jgi:hypothetical protein
LGGGSEGLEICCHQICKSREKAATNFGTTEAIIGTQEAIKEITAGLVFVRVRKAQKLGRNILSINYCRLRNSQNENEKQKTKKKLGCPAGLAVYYSLTTNLFISRNNTPMGSSDQPTSRIVHVVKRDINWLCLAKVNSLSSSDMIYSSHVCCV